ncbi:hormone-sensitive lipase [Drosophila hydei]|uniref:Hormone-sensitive lipase n=1 Tax=Drosophila hydei TaxID=7224 RepID=A0A6J1LFZ2_DROHY|nr:hormone-sensitive lipase [Drosophila hydei]XP_023162170.2 hormone-sensitive lipase [Drosophila hydei]XP_023162178.2 hormone-sensitive lipase [Drosophila hydei]XP_023162185.2 hormone-sensitive lipase [Drosophila hydei]XP_023162194.2 hormone-sensitive lipase [Drosophila hydei]
MIAVEASEVGNRSPKPTAHFEHNIKLARSKDELNGKVISAQTVTPTPTPADFQPTYLKLYANCQEHAAFFAKDHTEYGQRLHAAHIAWQDFIVLANRLVSQIELFAHEYDFDELTPGNGYRSFIYVTNACIKHGLDICQHLLATRGTLFFRKKFYMKEVEACSQLLCSICTCLQYLLILRQWSVNTGDLLASGRHTAEQLFELGDTINQYCFYGRCLGFQYGDSIRGVLRFLGIGMASYSETYYSQTDNSSSSLLKTTRSLWSSGKYLMNPELRARRIVNISQNAKIDFCKSFWFLAESELMHKLPSIVGSSIKVNRTIELPAEPLRLPARVQQTDNTSDTENELHFVDIPVPSAHLGPGLPVSVRLLSAKRRAGMLGEGRYRGWRRPSAPSKSILFHCHGGGFVAQSSKSHELYLRDWAVALDVPILSVDYSLAPEAPFPRALQEVYYAYCWLLNNAEHLGTTAERVICAGDSAGANLSIGLALKCIEQNVRVPDGLFLAYCPTLVSFVPSPARMLCLMDPLLPFGFMMRCLRAYAAPSNEMMQENAKHVEQLEEIRNAQAPMAEAEKLTQSMNSSRRTSTAKSPLTPLEPLNRSDEDESSDTFASASYHSQTVERTELPSTDNSDNSSCVSFEDDSQPIEHYPIEISAEIPKDAESAAYIDNFLDKYLIDTATIEATEDNTTTTAQLPLANGHKNSNSEENIIIETGREIIVDTLPGRLQEAVNNIINRCTQSYEIHSTAMPGPQDVRNLDALIARSPSEEFAFDVPKDPFLSPYWASDEWLSQLPETRILTLNMDPCLDDCVMLAKKLKRLGGQVHLDILEGLPHGFLNFTMLSNEAMDGSKQCIKSLQALLQASKDNNDDSTAYDATSSASACSAASAAP